MELAKLRMINDPRKRKVVMKNKNKTDHKLHLPVAY